jgi:2-octaprenyl-6-methoxyphenol hydroxylase
MNVCIIGDGLTSLSLAKNLVKKKIAVEIYSKKKFNYSVSTRTIGIAQNNLDFFKNEIIHISDKEIWKIKKIEIFSQDLKNKILDFDMNKDLFYMIKNDKLYKKLDSHLLKDNFFKKKTIRNDDSYLKLLTNKKYDLIFNCELDNLLSKKFFSKKIKKNYNNFSYTTILEHKKIKNDSASQIFTKYGPIAYLPISNTATSVVFSMEIKEKKYSDKNIIDLIKSNNPKYKIKKILKLNSFKIEASSLRNYYEKNILAFGDSLHKIHPLAGQGFNMTIRDIKTISKIIDKKISLGLQLDSSIFEEFENITKDKNFIFCNGIDFIYEFFNFDKKTKNKNLSKALKYLGRNKSFKNIMIKFADSGLNIL